jgi:hypothetical protein
MSLNTHQTGQPRQDLAVQLPLYRFLVGNGGNRLVGSKNFIGEVEAFCLVDAILAAEAKYPHHVYPEVIEALVKRRDPGGAWVDAEDWPETMQDAWYYATGEEVDGAAYA